MEPTFGLKDVARWAGEPVDRVGQWARDAPVGERMRTSPRAWGSIPHSPSSCGLGVGLPYDPWPDEDSVALLEALPSI